MNCKWCNKEIESNAKFCKYCGGSLVNEQNQESVQTNLQQPEQEQIIVNQSTVNTQTNKEENKVNVWFVILSVFIPLAGLIIFLVKKDSDKKTAKASGIAALISFGVSLIISIMSIITLVNIANRQADYIKDSIQDTTEELKEDIFDDNNNFDIESDDEETNLDEVLDEDIIDNTEISNNWTNYQFIVNNKTIKLPCKFDELSSVTETKMKSAEEKSYISPNHYAIVNLYKNEKLALHIELLNNSDKDIVYTEGMVTRVWQTKYQVSTGATVVTFPGGLKVGQTITKDEIVNLFGEPSDIKNYSNDGYVIDTYSYFSDDLYTTTNNYIIKVLNGVVDELILDHRHYE